MPKVSFKLRVPDPKSNYYKRKNPETGKFLHSKSDIPKHTPIYIRFRAGKFDKLLKTPSTADPRKWSYSKQKLKEDPDSIIINTKLNNLSNELLKSYNQVIASNNTLDTEWMKGVIDKVYSTAPKPRTDLTFFNNYLDYYIIAENKRLQVKSKQKNRKFEIDKNIPKLKNIISNDTRLTDINSKWLSKFEADWTNEGYSVNYIRKKIQLIRRVLNHARSKHPVADDYNDYELPEISDSFDVYLNEMELQLLFDKDFESDRLNNVKKLFLISATSGGLRVSDLMKIKDNLIDGNIIDIGQIQKTKRPLSIALDPRVKPFLNEIYPISDQKYNQYIKEMLDIVGITQLVEGHIRGKGNKKIFGVYPKNKVCSSHTARRSFASNYFGQLKLEDLMMILGHRSPQQTIDYVKLSSREHLKSFIEVLKEKYPEYYEDEN